MDNFSFFKMVFSNHNTNSSDDSESDPADCYEENSSSDVSSICSEGSDSSFEVNVNVTVDSTIRVPKKKYQQCYKITLDDVRQIEKVLEMSEFVSLIFLLFDTSYALQEIRSMIAAGPENFSRDKLSKWASTLPEKWNFKLFEGLAIIQINHVLMKHGFCKQDIYAMRNVPVYIDRFKKVLFTLVCDFLTREQAQELIDRVRRDENFVDDITLQCDPMYIEFHVLFWISQNYINVEINPDFDRLANHLKSMGFPHLFDEINGQMTEERRISNPISSPISNSDFINDCYKINDPNNPGLLIVVNNVKFIENREKRKELQDKLPEDHFDDREGSDVDVKHLKRTFERIHFKVVVRDDVYHDELIKEIHEAIRCNFVLGCHSILVLCVLSHGNKGVIYGVNSIPVKTEDISNSLCGVLSGTPKVIIIQACQGTEKIFVESEPKLMEPDGAGARSPVVGDGDDDLKLDGLENYNPADMLLCMATVEGFVAYRRLKTGTVYIQELCCCLNKYYTSHHILEIMTKVHNNVINQKLCLARYNRRSMCMVPKMSTTLQKNLFLTTNRSTSRHPSAL